MTTNNELIEKYFDKTLTEEEKVLFKEKYDQESDFREELKQQALLITSLKSINIQQTEDEENNTPRSIKIKKYWFSVATIAASIVILMFIYSSFNKQIDDVEEQIKQFVLTNDKNNKLIADYVSELSLLKDSIEQLSIIKNSLEQQGDNQHIYNDMLYASLILMTKDDKEVKGENNTLTFLSPNRKQPLPSSITIKWTPINSIGDIEIRYLDKDYNKKIDTTLSSSNYDLNSGYYPLMNLKRNTMYFFMIKTDTEEYIFPFITDK
jgi:hypothetical protein